MKQPSTNRIAEHRKRAGLTQQDLAEKLGVHWITISKLERGQTRLTIDWMEKISSALGVGTFDLVTRPKAIATVQLTGRILPGAEIEPFPDDEPRNFTIRTDYIVDSETLWFVVEDDALYPWFHTGDHIGAGYTAAGPDEHIGRLCLIWDENNDAHLGILAPSKQKGRYDLHRPSLPPIRNKLVTNISPIVVALYATSLVESEGYLPGLGDEI
ncbi:helix-turn-helix transcriptional regulator [Sinorhizobium chiapasense]